MQLTEKSRLLPAVIALLCTLIDTAWAQQTTTEVLIPIGRLRPSAVGHAYDINDTRYVVGRGQKGFRWTPGTLLNQSSVLAPNKPWSEVSAVNNSGAAVGTAGTNGGGYGEPFMWTAATGYVSLGSFTVGGVGIARDINNKGEVIVHDAAKSYLRSANGTVTAIPDLGGGVIYARGMNSATTTQVVGASKQAGGAFAPFVWTASAGTKALPVATGQQGFALGINNSGVAVGWVGETPQIPLWDFAIVGDREAAGGIFVATDPWSLSYLEPLQATPAIWTGGKLVTIPVPPGYTHGVAHAINNAGEIVGTMIDGNNKPRAFYYTSVGGMQWLDERFAAAANGANPPWSFLVATAINNYGEIAGFGLRQPFFYGYTEAFVLVPPSARAANIVQANVALAMTEVTPRAAGTGLAVGDVLNYTLTGKVSPAATLSAGSSVTVKATLRLLPSSRITLTSTPVGCAPSGSWLACPTTLVVTNTPGGTSASFQFQAKVAKAGRLITRAEIAIDHPVLDPGYSKVYLSANAYSTRIALPRYRVVELGLAPNGDEVHGYSINNYRQFVGKTLIGRSFIWQRGMARSIESLWCNQPLPPNDCGDWQDASAINDAGWITGVTGVAQSNTSAMRWRPPMLRNEAVQPFAGMVMSFGSAVDANGMIAGFYRNVAGDDVAAVWSATGVRVDLGTFGGRRSFALGLNGVGKVVGAAAAVDGKLHAFSWDGAAKTDLGMVSNSNTVAVAINNNNVIAGWYGAEPERTNISIVGPLPTIVPPAWYYVNKLIGHDTLNFSSGAFVHANGVYRDLGPGMAYAVNKNGMVVGFTTNPGKWSEPPVGEGGPAYGHEPLRRAFLYDTARSRMYDVNDLAVHIDGTPATDYLFFAAASINDNGDILGWAQHAGSTKPFLLIPDSEPVRDVAIAWTQLPAATLHVGDVLSYSFSVTNNANQSAAATLDAAVDWSAASAQALPAQCAPTATGLHCNFGTLAAHASVSYSVQFKALATRSVWTFAPRVDTSAGFESAWSNNTVTSSRTILP